MISDVCQGLGGESGGTWAVQVPSLSPEAVCAWLVPWPQPMVQGPFRLRHLWVTSKDWEDWLLVFTAPQSLL